MITKEDIINCDINNTMLLCPSMTNKDYQKQWRKKHPDKRDRSEYNKAYRKINKVKLNEYNRQYYVDNKDDITKYALVYHKQYYHKNKTIIKKQTKQYQEEHYKLHPIKRLTLEERFWTKVIKADNCWKWIGSKYPNGYGYIYYNKNHIGSHRVSWEIHNGIIPDKMCVLHKCDNPNCINPKHLFLGTMSDNTKDMVSKHRGRWDLIT